jgi:hypothetical protein
MGRARARLADHAAMTVPSRDQIESFYRAAALGLTVLEARAGSARRFGPDADARWNAFRGALQDWHRLDLLVRDAAVANAAGFAPRVVFSLPALADDEPAGPEWTGAPPDIAANLLRQAAAAAPPDLDALLGEIARIWHLEPAEVSQQATAGIEPATRLACAGAGAVLALARAFDGRSELDFADQVTLIAEDPGTRQLFGLAITALGGSRAGSQRPARVLATASEPTGSAGPAQSAEPGHADRIDWRIDRAIVSADALPAAREALGRLAQDHRAPMAS